MEILFKIKEESENTKRRVAELERQLAKTVDILERVADLTGKMVDKWPVS